MKYTCCICGRVGSEDDGIDSVLDPCPDEECDGIILFTREGYMEILDDLHIAVQDELIEPGATGTITFNSEQLGILMNALNNLIEDIAYRDLEPWENW